MLTSGIAKGKLLLLLAGFTLLAGALAFVGNRTITEEGEESTPPAAVRGVAALGTVEPASRILTISARDEPALVGALHVHVGQLVEVGGLLATTADLEVRQALVEEARAKVAAAQQRLRRVEAGAEPSEVAALTAVVESARFSATQRSRDADRARQLASGGGAAISSAENAELMAQEAKLALQEAEARLAALATVRPEDVDVAAKELAVAEAAFRSAEASLDQCFLRAPVRGTVLKINARPQERIGTSGLLQLADLSRMHVVAEVFEADVPRVRLGASANARLQTTPLEVSGRVVEIGSLVGRRVALDNDPVTDTDARVIEVRVALDEAGSVLLAGLSNARVSVLIGENK